MGKLRQQAEQRASELLKTSDVKLNRDAGTYQLINKATGKTENLPLSGIDVGSGLFAKNRRVNRLIGKSLTRDSEMSTVGETPAQVQPSAPTGKQPEVKAATGEQTTTAPAGQSTQPWDATSVKNRFSLGSPSTLIPRRLTFAPDEQFKLGFGAAQKQQETTTQQSTTGPVANTPSPYSTHDAYNRSKRSTIDDETNSQIVKPASALVAKNQPALDEFINANYKTKGYLTPEAYKRRESISETSPDVVAWRAGLNSKQEQIAKSKAQLAQEEQDRKDKLPAHLRFRQQLVNSPFTKFNP